jgi:NDP-sugar pyrophosphorylase family protein
VSLDLPIALLAGGLATRLRPLTEKIPKSLLEVAGEPFIIHQLRLFQSQGARRVVICAGYLGQMIEEAVGDGAQFGLEVRYSFDGPVLMGTGGALRQALPLLGEAFAVLYGDSWLDYPYAKIERHFLESGKSGLMTVFRNDGAWDRSNIEFRDGGIRRYDKREITQAMHHIDWGLGFLRADVLTGWPEGPFDLADVYDRLLQAADLAAYEVPTRFFEIGSTQGLAETDRLLRDSPRFS